MVKVCNGCRRRKQIDQLSSVSTVYSRSHCFDDAPVVLVHLLVPNRNFRSVFIPRNLLTYTASYGGLLHCGTTPGGIMAKKEAHAKALEIYIKSKGKTPLSAIAEAVGVSSFSVGRWHKMENWKEKIKGAPTSHKQNPVQAASVRNKDLFDQAVKLFNESGGKISNTALSKQIGVSPTSIANWKKMPQWSEGAAVAVIPEPSETPSPEIAPPIETAPAPQVVDLESITSPQDLIALNERLRAMLLRDFLTADELEHLSNAKLILLEAAEVYLGIVQGRDE